DLVPAADGATQFAVVYFHLRRLAGLGLLRYTLRVDGEPLVVVEPMVGGPRPTAAPIDADVRCRLSRFAYCRREGDTLVLESPRCRARVLLARPHAAALIAALAQPRSAGELSAQHARLSEEPTRALLGLLASLDLVGAMDEHGALAENADPTLQQWEFHDL